MTQTTKHLDRTEHVTLYTLSIDSCDTRPGNEVRLYSTAAANE